MIETIALVLFFAVILAMVFGPENKVRVTRTETVKVAPAKSSVAQTAG